MVKLEKAKKLGTSYFLQVKHSLLGRPTTQTLFHHVHHQLESWNLSKEGRKKGKETEKKAEP